MKTLESLHGQQKGWVKRANIRAFQRTDFLSEQEVKGFTSSLQRDVDTGLAGNTITFVRDGFFLMRNSCPWRTSGKFLLQ